MKFILILLHLLFLYPRLDAQKIRSETVTYSYHGLPLSPLPASIRNYTVRIDAPYEEKNRQLQAAYDAEKKKADEDYQAELASFPARLKAAEAQYEKELAEYNKKSLPEKIVEKNVLGENNRPVKNLPLKPAPPVVPPPSLKTTYDLPMLASTWLQLSGFRDEAANAVQVIVTFYGFDHTEPRVISAQKDMVSIAKGSTSTYKSTYYHVEFSYRHPMSVKVIHPDGRELLALTPQQLNTYTIYKSPSADTYPSFNRDLLIKTHEEKKLQENLKLINDLINDQFGSGKKEQKADLYYVKEKGDTYADLTLAFNEASSALHLLYDDPERGKSGLQKAVGIWKAALAESQPASKKARIDRDVTLAIMNNLCEAYFALGATEEGFAVLQQMNTLSLSAAERRDRDALENRFSDLKKRQQNQPRS